MVSVDQDVAAPAARTVATFFLLVTVGALCAFFPRRGPGGEQGLLSESTSRRLSLVATRIMVPCLSAFTIGSNITPKVIRELWPLLLWGFIAIPIAMTLGSLVMLLMRVPKRHRRVFLLAIAFPNVVGLPLVLVEAMCREPQLDGEVDCVNRARAYIFLPVVGWGTLFWSLGVFFLRGTAPGARNTQDAQLPRWQRWWTLAKELMLSVINPPFMGICVGLFIALVPTLQSVFFGEDPALSFVAETVRILSAPAVGVINLILGASLGRSLRRIAWPAPLVNCVHWLRRKLCSPTPPSANGTHAEPAMEAKPATNGAETQPAATPTEQTELERSESYAQAIETDLDTLEDAQPTKVVDPKKDGMSFPVLIALVVCRIILMPIVAFCIVHFALSDIMSGTNANLGSLILYAECFVPTANLVVVVANQMGLPAAAENVALTMAVQYLFLIPVLIIGLSLSLSAVYPDVASNTTVV